MFLFVLENATCLNVFIFNVFKVPLLRQTNLSCSPSSPLYRSKRSYWWKSNRSPLRSPAFLEITSIRKEMETNEAETLSAVFGNNLSHVPNKNIDRDCDFGTYNFAQTHAVTSLQISLLSLKTPSIRPLQIQNGRTDFDYKIGTPLVFG